MGENLPCIYEMNTHLIFFKVGELDAGHPRLIPKPTSLTRIVVFMAGRRPVSHRTNQERLAERKSGTAPG